MSLLLATSVAAMIAFAAVNRGALTRGGGLAAWAVGTAVLAGGSWAGGSALIVFFLTSTIVTRATEHRFPRVIDRRGTTRDASQVLANGGAALAGGLVALVAPGPGLWIIACSLAVATADTWATGFGALSRVDPVDFAHWRRVAPGTSGGVSLPGTVGGAIGAAAIAGTLVLAGHTSLGLACLPVGIGGMLTDSLLGATLQARYRCAACGLEGEEPAHCPGAAAVLEGGVRWVNNDGVNAIATTAGGLAGLVLWHCCSPS